jgi:hypothetical protein
MSKLQTHPTPNPNSLKFTTDEGPFLASGLVSLNSAEEAAQHPLGRLLFAIDAVCNVLVLPRFLTVTKTPDGDWDRILPRVEAAVAEYFATGLPSQ